ncbi:MAG: chromosome segregation protein SMC [Ekhidna sp.]
MQENSSSDNQPEYLNPKKNRTPLFLILIFLLIAAIVFFYNQNQNLEAEKALQETEISNTYLKLDSISSELDQKILTIKELGGNIDTLTALKQQLEEDKRSLISRDKNQRSKITQLNNRVDGYKELLLIKDSEIEELQKINEELAEENTTLKVEKNQLNQSIQQLEKNKEELAGKVAVASRLQIEGMKTYAVSEGGREREGEFRNRHINQLKIQFSVLENQIAPIEGKDLLLRVIGPDGNVLFDVTRGSGSFTFEGREMFYTATQEILYDKNSQLVTYLYDKGSDYSVGQHKVEVYTDNYLMGKGSFMVK